MPDTPPRRGAKKAGAATRMPGAPAPGPKTAKTYRLSEAKIAAARRILGVATATAAIETALDMVVFRQELVDGTARMLGVEVASLDEV